MSYWGNPEQQIDPPQMSARYESNLNEAEKLVQQISILHSKVENSFEELTEIEIEEILDEAQYLLDEINNLSDEEYSFEDEYSDGSWRVDEIEEWLHDKEAAKTEVDKK
jgi:mevalonate kinase